MTYIKRLFLLCCVCLVQDLFAQQIADRINFNRDWKFYLGDVQGAQVNSFDDKKWERIGIPHSFSIPYFMSSDFYVGYGWYRKVFNVDPRFKHKKLFIEFEGVFQDAEIFVNGKNCGRHQGGYTGFIIDITDHAKVGKNVISVKVNNLWNAQLAPRAGEHVFSGGIYRDVYFVASPLVYVAWNGTYITTPKVDNKNATVKVNTEVVNEQNTACSATLKTKIFSPAGMLIRTIVSQKVIEPGKTAVFEQLFTNIDQPLLWDPGHPNLYKAESTVSYGSSTGVPYRTDFGIRSIEWTEGGGFYLNEKHVYLLGANAHQDHAGWGDAVTNSGFVRDVKMIKDAGFNFIRGSHYPHDPAYLDACDRMGIMFWSENAFWGIGGSSNTPDGYWNTTAYPSAKKDREGFAKSVKQQLTEMIRIHRNHPSVIAWSMSNEPFFSAKETMLPVAELLKETVALAHKLDPSRPAAIGGSQRPLDSTRIDRLGDIAGYNGDGASLAAFQHPGVPSIISEYGSTTADRPGTYAPGWGDLSKDKGLETFSWRSGQAIWCAFDHGSIAGSALGKMGIVDYFRIPKRAYYWYRNEYRHIPPPAWAEIGEAHKLKIDVDKRNKIATDGTDDVQLLVSVLGKDGRQLANSPDITLKVISGPGRFPTGQMIHFSAKSDIRVMDGQASIEFRSYQSGETVIEASSPGLRRSLIKLKFENGPIYTKKDGTGVTEKVYVRFVNHVKTGSTKKFGPNNPTFASSSLNGHDAGFAADGDDRTFWKASPGATNPSWTLDMERAVEIEKIRIIFQQEKIHRYKVELSDNRIQWKIFIDKDQGTDVEHITSFPEVKKDSARYVRISFLDAQDAAISEVEVTGIPIG